MFFHKKKKERKKEKRNVKYILIIDKKDHVGVDHFQRVRKITNNTVVRFEAV